MSRRARNRCNGFRRIRCVPGCRRIAHRCQSRPLSVFVVSHFKQPTLEVRLYGPGEAIPANKGDIGFINSGRDPVKVFDTVRHLHELNLDQAKTSAGSQFAYS